MVCFLMLQSLIILSFFYCCCYFIYCYFNYFDDKLCFQYFVFCYREREIQRDKIELFKWEQDCRKYLFFMNIKLYTFFILFALVFTIGFLFKVLSRVFSKDHFGKLPGNNFLTRYLDTCAFVNWKLGRRCASNRWREVTP